MGRGSRPKKKTPKNAVEKLRKDLRGGVGNAPAGQSPFANLQAAESAALEPVMSRLEVQRPTLAEGVRKRMSVKQPESRQQIAEATLQAAIQHRNAPDAGSDLYRQAFLSLDEATRSRLLSSLPEADAQLVQGIFVGDASLPKEVAPSPAKPLKPEDRAKEAARKALAEHGLEAMPTVNMDTGETVIHYVKRGSQPGVQKVDRLTPSTFAELSPDAQRAASLGMEIRDAVSQMEQWNPDFLDTAEGRRLADEMSDLLEAHPEIESHIDDPRLEGRQVPAYGDAVSDPSGRAALPPSMRLSTYIGGEEAASFKLAEQPERRTGRYKDIPADAPNRMAWIVLKDAEEATQKGITIQELRRRRSGGQATGPQDGLKPERRASAVVVGLPTPDDILEKELKRLDRANLNYSGPGLQQRKLLDAPKEQPVKLSESRAAELDAQAAEASRKVKEARGQSGPAAPVEDISQTDAAWEAPIQRIMLPGSATGSPKQVAWDRNYALREGRSFADKWREKIVRMANEMVDPSTVTSGRGLGIPEAADAADEIGDSMRDQVMLYKTGGDEPIRKNNAGGGGRVRDERSQKPLPLDALVPAWRGNMYFDNGTEIVVRRPNALEVAGFLLDRLDLPDAGMATRLETYVQQAMDALEDKVPSTARAKRAAATIYEPPAAYRNSLEQTVASRRSPGDQRPLVNDQSFADASQYAEEMGASVGSADADWQPETVDALPDPDAGDVAAQSGSEWSATSDAASAGSMDRLRQMAEAEQTNLPDPGQQQSGIVPAIQSMFARFRKGSSGGNAPNNIGSILALLGAASAAGSAQAESGELPPVEYIAMAGRGSRKARDIANKARSKATTPPQTAPAPAPAPAPQPAQQAAGPAPLPPRRRRPAPAPAQPAAQAATAQTAPTAPPSTPAAGTPPPATTKPPRGPLFPNDPIANSVRAVLNVGSKTGIGGYLPTLLYLAASAPKFEEDSPAAFRFMQNYNPIQGYGAYLYNKAYGPSDQPQGQPLEQRPAQDMQQLFQELDANMPADYEPFPVDQQPEPIPSPRPASSNQVEALKQMMNQTRPAGYRPQGY